VLFSAFKNFSVVHELEVVGQLLRAAGGGITFEDALAYTRSSSFIRLDGEGGHVTNERVRQEERQMLAAVKEAWDKCPALIPGEREIQDPMVKRSANQSEAARFLWTSRDMVMDVSGIAGAGKTGDVPTKVRKTPRDLAQTRIYTTRCGFLRLPKSDCFQAANFGALIPTESWSFSSEKSYSPSRLICCQDTTEPFAMAWNRISRASGPMTSLIFWDK
jgi:hypothetical protein